MKRILSTLALAAVAVVLSGCVIALGNRGEDRPRPKSATLGQELTDLKKAREAGALSEEEYQAQKQRALSAHDHK